MAVKNASENKRKNYNHKMRHIMGLIHSTLDFDEIMKRTIRETARAVNCETASILLRQEEKWVVGYVYGFPEDLTGLCLEDRIGLCLDEKDLNQANLAINARKIITVKDAFNDPRINAESAKKWNTHSLIVLPLFTQKESIGVIIFNYNKICPHFSKSLIDFLTNISFSISLAIQNSFLYHTVRTELAERKKVEERLQHTSLLNAEILETISDGFYSLDRDWRITYINRHAANNMGFEPADLTGRNIWEAIPALKDTFMEAHLRKAMSGQKAVQFEHEGFVTEKYFHCNVYPSEEGILIYWMDVTERKKQQEVLLKAEREKNEALRKTIEMKDEFISLISHEFKTPLTVINSAIQAMKLLCRNELSDRANKYLNKILQNSNRQLKLVNNLLDITRINAGQLKVMKSDLDIVSLTRSITESIRIFAEQKGIRLSFSSTLGKKVIGIDEEKYERILLNLLSNAVKYTPKGRSVAVRVSQKIVEGKCMVCVQVKDQGVGIPDDKKELIFERFGQVDSSLSRQAEGTGIGLHLVKMFVGLLDGKISLDSTVGKGSTFTVLLPVKKVKETPIEHLIKEISDHRLIQATSIEFSDVYLQ